MWLRDVLAGEAGMAPRMPMPHGGDGLEHQLGPNP